MTSPSATAATSASVDAPAAASASAPWPAGPQAGVAAELDKEARMGGRGAVRTRELRRISLRDFEARRAGIRDALWEAATTIGFFQLVDHGLPQPMIDAAFGHARDFFALPDALKAQWPHRKAHNVGWESRAQVRPSTGTPDQKESYQITRPHMDGLWPTEAELPGFRAAMLDFEARCWTVAMQVLSCLGEALGFAPDFFARAHDPAAATYQSTLRLLHYHAMPPVPVAATPDDTGLWRAGAHTDFDCLTLLFQRAGQGGLQVCPGQDMDSRAWTEIDTDEAAITCNIGDMLMRWSDDRLPSNFHRVRNPGPGESTAARQSIAFFAQANTDAWIEGPARKYPPITAGDYLRQRVAANFART